MANKLKYLVLFLGAGMIFTACSDLAAKEIARVPVNNYEPGLNYKELNIRLKKGEKIAIWSEMDMEYDGSVEMEYTIEMSLNGKQYPALQFNPFEKSVTINETKITAGDHTKWKYSGKNAEITIKDTGRYKFVAVLKTSLNPTLRMKQPQIILKRKN